jgi:hypothetical protein
VGQRTGDCSSPSSRCARSAQGRDGRGEKLLERAAVTHFGNIIRRTLALQSGIVSFWVGYMPKHWRAALLMAFGGGAKARVTQRDSSMENSMQRDENT